MSTYCPAAIAPDLPRILILDADDSYTRNILDLILKACPSGALQPTELDSRVLIVRAGRFDWPTLSTQIIPHFAAIILGPGPGRPAPASSGASVPACEHPAATFTRIFSPEPLPALGGHHIPTFGLCLGHQALGFAYGAVVQPAPLVLHGQLSSLELELDPSGRGKGILDRVAQGARVVRYNSLTVDPSSLSPELEVTAWAQDGEFKTVMGLAHKTLPFYSVQFHPESVCSSSGTEIMRSFLAVVSRSAHVNLGISQSTAYSPLPAHILEYSEIGMGLPFVAKSGLNGLRAFELRSLVFTDNPHSPQGVFEASVRGTSTLGEVWLDSADSSAGGAPGKSRNSHMASPDVLVSYFAADKTLVVRRANLPKSDRSLAKAGFWAWLRSVQQDLEASTHILSSSGPVSSSDGSTKPPPSGAATSGTPLRAPVGFLGYIGYELLSESLSGYDLPCRSSTSVPDAELGFCNTALTYDHQTRTWAASALVRVDEQQSEYIAQHFGGPVGVTEAGYAEWAERIHALLSSPPGLKQSTVPRPAEPRQTTLGGGANPRPSLCLEPIVNESDYLDAIVRAQTEILAGESYELCLTTQFRAMLEGAEEHYARYLGLRRANPAPYAAFIHFSANDTHILSASPERFMRIDGGGRVEMKPIKGTARRIVGDDVADKAVATALQANAKERAENLMITDLIRHDLHGFCVPGSVSVSALFAVETVATVHSLVSTVVGQLRRDLNCVDALRAAFPPGSMTGAPKIRSVEILDGLESGKARGVYSGIIGLVAVDGRSDMSVVIRTAVVRGSEVVVGGGGAITSLSNKEDEWKEVKLKVEAVQRNLGI